jgi:UDP-glucose 4-epimerase
VPTASHRNQTVLVTGGLGFIGSHTAVELLKSGYNVLIIDDLSNSYSEALEGIRTIAQVHYEKMGLGGQCPKVDFRNMSYRDIPAMRMLLRGYQSAASPATSRPPSVSHGLLGGTRTPSYADNIVGAIHFAAHKAVGESIRQPIKYYQNNLNGLVDFMALLDECGIKTFIFSSSASVYGTLADGTRVLREENCVLHSEVVPQSNKEGLEVRESTPGRPVTPTLAPVPLTLPQSGCVGITNPYGRSKYFGEAILADLVASDPTWNVIVLRYFNPVGCDPSGLLAEDPKGVPSNLVPVVVQVMTGQRPELYIYGDDWDTADGTAVRDFVHVTDIARGHTAALAAALEGRIHGSGFRTFNLGAGMGHSVLDVVKAMEIASGRQIPRKIVGRRPGDVQSSIAATDRARDELGWEPRESLFTACRDICNRLNIIKT